MTPESCPQASPYACSPGRASQVRLGVWEGAVGSEQTLFLLSSIGRVASIVWGGIWPFLKTNNRPAILLPASAPEKRGRVHTQTGN